MYIQSDGLNYDGTYREYAVIDHRLAISMSVAYVAVKAPKYNAPSDVVISAFVSLLPLAQKLFCTGLCSVSVGFTFGGGRVGHCPLFPPPLLPPPLLENGFICQSELHINVLLIFRVMGHIR
jgi:hypothetical protein